MSKTQHIPISLLCWWSATARKSNWQWNFGDTGFIQHDLGLFVPRQTSVLQNFSFWRFLKLLQWHLALSFCWLLLTTIMSTSIWEKPITQVPLARVSICLLFPLTVRWCWALSEPWQQRVLAEPNNPRGFRRECTQPETGKRNCRRSGLTDDKASVLVPDKHFELVGTREEWYNLSLDG